MDRIKGLTCIWPDPSGSCPTVLLAVSGGMDSMCMADLFLKEYGPSSFAVAHCNFNLRGEESDADEALVKEWCDCNHVRLHSTSFDTLSYQHENGLSMEMAARELRYRWFADLCKTHAYRAVAVAHNANDNAETLILNLLRGTGVDGLHAMSELSRLPCAEDADDLFLFRPLLSFTRKQIHGRVFANRIPFRDDKSNFSSDYKRNRIRNEVFPIFEKLNPSFIQTLNRSIGYFRDAGDIVEDWCRRESMNLISRSGCDALNSGNCLLRIDTECLLDAPHWKYLLYHLLSPYGFNASVLASVEDLLLSGRTFSGKRFDAAEYVLFTERNELRVVRKENSGLAEDKTLMVRSAGIYHFNGRQIKVEILPWTADMPLRQPEGVQIFDAAALEMPFMLREWEQGDWLIPLGMRGRKKVSDIFTDLKYDAFMKKDSVMIVDILTEGMAENHHIAAVAGLRMDKRYMVTSDTSSIVKISSL